MKHYEIEIANVKRNLPIFPVNDELSIAALIIFGDVELTQAAAGALNKIAPEHDIMITAESKSIPLIHEMARQSNVNDYVVARKTVKVYMGEPISVEVHSITTAKKQQLYVDKADINKMKGKRVLIVDDVISTGESLKAIEKLVRHAGGEVVGKMAILAEGDAIHRTDITFLEPLPLFKADGTPIEQI